MNEKMYQELLVKTASFDPSTVLLYKVAGIAKAVQQGANQPAVKRTVKDIVKGLLDRGTQFVANNAKKMEKDIGTIAAKGKWVSDNSMFPAVSESPNKRRMLIAMLNILKNPLTIGAAGATALNAGIAGGAGYAGAKMLDGKKQQDAAPAADQAAKG